MEEQEKVTLDAVREAWNEVEDLLEEGIDPESFDIEMSIQSYDLDIDSVDSVSVELYTRAQVEDFLQDVKTRWLRMGDLVKRMEGMEAASPPDTKKEEQIAQVEKGVADLLATLKKNEGTAPQTGEELLDVVDTFLSSASMEEGKKAWDVLTALRGPDQLGGKWRTVAIRRAALPKTADTGSISQYAYFSTTSRREEAEALHFAGHVAKAIRVLQEWGRDPFSPTV